MSWHKWWYHTDQDIAKQKLGPCLYPGCDCEYPRQVDKPGALALDKLWKEMVTKAEEAIHGKCQQAVVLSGGPYPYFSVGFYRTFEPDGLVALRFATSSAYHEGFSAEDWMSNLFYELARVELLDVTQDRLDSFFERLKPNPWLTESGDHNVPDTATT